MFGQFSSLSLNELEGGYDYKFIEEPADSLKCLICLLVVREPQQHGGCGKLFCKVCIGKYRRNDCPHCRQPIRASGYQQFGGTIFNDFKSELNMSYDIKIVRIHQCAYITNSRPLVERRRYSQYVIEAI